MKRLLMLMLSSLLLLTSVVVAQENNYVSLLSQLSAVIFILTFILILLWLGGVIKPGTGRGIPWFMIFFIAIIILLFVIPQFVPYPVYLEVPENFKIVPLPRYAAEFMRMLGLPEEWMYVPAIIYLFILPFAGIYTLVWAFLTALKIFEGAPSSVNRILAFIITFLTIPVGWFVKIVWVVFSFIGVWSVVIFAAMFILALFFRGYGYVERERYATMKHRQTSRVVSLLEKAIVDVESKQKQSAKEKINDALTSGILSSEQSEKLRTAIDYIDQEKFNNAKENIEKVLRELK